MKAKKIGLYLGINSIGIAVMQAKSVISLGKFELSSLEESRGEELDDDIRWEALINKGLREAGVDAEEVFVSLADRDFIFRQFEMPLMKKKEVESSLIYEVEKYIPFKIDELEWDYGCVRLFKERKVNISFVGIRSNNIRRVQDTLSRLKIKAPVIEPSCLSLVRVMKSLKKFSKLKDFALLDFTESEFYLTFFQDDLPVFNRYLAIPKKDNSVDLNKFIEAVTLSLQYFKREFKASKLEKFIVIGDDEDKSLSSSLQEELQLDTENIFPHELGGRNNAEVENIKALGAAGRSHYPYKFKPILKRVQVPEGGVSSAAVPSLRIGLLSSLTVAGIVISIFLSVFMGTDASIKIKQLEKKLIIPAEFKNISSVEREKMVKQREDRINALKTISSSYEKLSEFLNILSEPRIVLPGGVWLDTMNISRRDNAYIVSLSGYIFRDDAYKETSVLNEFISNLDKNSSVKSIFSTIEMDSSERRPIKEFDATYFTIKLR